MRLTSTMMAIALASAVFAAKVHADDHHRDHDVARQAVDRGEIKPLAEILESVRNRFPGDVARVKIEREGKRLVYELRIVDIQGRLLEIHVDAATGAIGRTKEK